MAFNPNFNDIGKNFAQVYYQTFDTNRANLASLYESQSMLTFEGDQFQGREPIMKKLTGLPFTTVKHVITTIDCQPSTDNGVVVFVVGQLKTDDDPPHGFSQCFHLKPGSTNYFVLHDMFRLTLHHG
ncbi:nuclear transport factor 2-like [Stylophora pistillata]|uniref:Nuclear transport factor 2 n=1 Tax=Stylophora pistillata TaxID=50429 RepID=A0A2B4STG9_STYPI|nr:nuclear transport factor 2-like [Stylophora pistillata]PFX33201.1 Nuclear transport factor 2 [Stylophora pistillata]